MHSCHFCLAIEHWKYSTVITITTTPVALLTVNVFYCWQRIVSIHFNISCREHIHVCRHTALLIQYSHICHLLVTSGSFTQCVCFPRRKNEIKKKKQMTRKSKNVWRRRNKIRKKLSLPKERFPCGHFFFFLRWSIIYIYLHRKRIFLFIYILLMFSVFPLEADGYMGSVIYILFYKYD